MRKRPFLLLATEFLLGIVCVREQLPAWGALAVLLLVYTTPWKERGMRKVLFAAGLPGMFLLGMLQMQRQIDFRQQSCRNSQMARRFAWRERLIG